MMQAEEPREGAVPIAPPSQIGLDLLRPPAPPQIAATTARAPGAAASSEFSVGVDQGGGNELDRPAPPESFKRFEAMVLQTFIQNMLPKDSAAVYGKGMAGDMWKSMLAEKMADAMAERGGIGIADRVLGDRYAAGRSEPSDKTAASVDRTSATVGDALGDSSRVLVAPAVIDGMQRSLSGLPAGEAPEAAVQSVTKRG
jgi:peptidoglycan hydrolase FlgJ